MNWKWFQPTKVPSSTPAPDISFPWLTPYQYDTTAGNNSSQTTGHTQFKLLMLAPTNPIQNWMQPILLVYKISSWPLKFAGATKFLQQPPHISVPMLFLIKYHLSKFFHTMRTSIAAQVGVRPVYDNWKYYYAGTLVLNIVAQKVPDIRQTSLIFRANFLSKWMLKRPLALCASWSQSNWLLHSQSTPVALNSLPHHFETQF